MSVDFSHLYPDLWAVAQKCVENQFERACFQWCQHFQTTAWNISGQCDLQKHGPTQNEPALCAPHHGTRSVHQTNQTKKKEEGKSGEEKKTVDLLGTVGGRMLRCRWTSGVYAQRSTGLVVVGHPHSGSYLRAPLQVSVTTWEGSGKEQRRFEKSQCQSQGQSTAPRQRKECLLGEGLTKLWSYTNIISLLAWLSARLSRWFQQRWRQA